MRRDIYITPYLNGSQITSGYTCLHLWRRQGGDLHTVLARPGVTRKGSWHLGAVCRFESHRARGVNRFCPIQSS